MLTFEFKVGDLLKATEDSSFIKQGELCLVTELGSIYTHGYVKVYIFKKQIEYWLYGNILQKVS